MTLNDLIIEYCGITGKGKDELLAKFGVWYKTDWLAQAIGAEQCLAIINRVLAEGGQAPWDAQLTQRITPPN